MSVAEFSQTCDLCDFEVKCKGELKSHRLSYSYIDVKYKCADCEYVGENDESMHVHIGRAHSENFECDLCSENLGKNILVHVKCLNATIVTLLQES